METVKRPPSDDPFTPPARKTPAAIVTPFRCPMSGTVAPNKPLNSTHPTGPRVTTYTPSQINRLDPFETLKLPERVKEIYREVRKIDELYGLLPSFFLVFISLSSLQIGRRCLADERLLRGGNFIFSLPTGAGKTLVAELLMLRCLLQHYQDVILILPFVAIVQEKAVSLAKFEELFGFSIEEYAGSRGRVPPPKRRKARLFVCTIEKANILVNSMITEQRMGEIGLVIVDELHMLGEKRRGTCLEQCLAKLMVVSSGIQLVGMSATLSSLPELRKFLRAHVFATDFRPVPLQEFVRYGERIFKYDPRNDETIYEKEAKRAMDRRLDEDGVVGLIADVIPNKSVLIFCPSRSNAENLCNLMAKNVPKAIREWKAAEKQELINQIIESNEGAICSTMRKGIEAGIVYHHSGLTREERVIVEQGFKDEILCVICATSTLAAGVNLPARRVIVKRFKIGRDTLSKATYLQMIGRAGRAGLDTHGEAFVILGDQKDYENFRRVRAEAVPPISSGMMDPDCLEAFVLDLFVLKITKNERDVQNTLKHTMYEYESDNRETAVREAIHRLKERKLINEDFETTEFGRATSNGRFLPVHAHDIHSDLMRTLDSGLILSSQFHLLSIIVPYNLDVQAFDFEFFYDLQEAERCGERLMKEWGLDERKVGGFCWEKPKFPVGSRESRVYLTLILKMLWEHQNLSTIAEKFRVNRGWVANLVTAACSHANQIVRFTAEIPAFWAFQQLLPDLLQQLYASAQPSFSQLLQIDCVKRKRAELLYKAGFKNVGAVARASPAELVQKIPFLGLPQAARIVASAKFLLRYVIDEKAEELEQWGAVDIFGDSQAPSLPPTASPPFMNLSLNG